MTRTLSVAVALLVGCTKASFVVPESPVPPTAPAAPEVPTPVAVPAGVELAVDVDGVRVAHDERAQPLRLAILPVTVTEAAQEHMGLATAWQIEDRLPRILLEAGLSHFIGPDVLMAVPAEKQANRDGTVRWSAPLGTLMQVEPVTAADLVLGLEVRHAATVAWEAPVSYRLEPGDAQTYARRYAEWKPVADGILAQLRQERADYDTAWQQAAVEYQDGRGKYGDDPDDPTSGDLAREQRREVLQRLDGRIQALERQMAETPAADDLAKAVAARQDTQTVPAFELELRARLVDAKSLQVQWLADLSTRDADQEAALQRVLETLVAEVR